MNPAEEILSEPQAHGAHGAEVDAVAEVDEAETSRRTR